MSPGKLEESTESQKSDIGSLSKDKRLNSLLKSIVLPVKQYAEDQIRQIRRLTDVGLALSAEKNINKLLEMIVDEARDLSNADAGTLYILDKYEKHLLFEILQNDTLKTRLGGTSGKAVTLPNVPLFIDGKPNFSNVSSYAALTGESINIPDVYEAEGFDFTGPRNYDKATGYRSRSMMVVPMKNHENEIIGVLQLLNAQDQETREVIPFSFEHAGLIASLGSLAAVALTNTQLIQELNSLFYAFIKSIATAIDEKSPYTGGHVNRVVDLTMMMAEKINEMREGPFRDVSFDRDQIEELKMAAWMHDVGKITTPEYVVDKATKLQTIFDRIHLIETRVQLIALSLENDLLQRKLLLMKEGKVSESRLAALDEAFEEKLSELSRDLSFIRSCNKPDELMEDHMKACIEAIAKKTYVICGAQYPYLTSDEVHNLCVQKGSLTVEERQVVENHALMTMKILQQLPFPRKFAMVPEYASSHHEKLDGSGYPRHLTGKDLPLQSRMMAVADIFDALTAKDRPYKNPMKLSMVKTIMEFMKKNGHIDGDIYDLFVGSGLIYDYALKHMSPDQIDEEIIRGVG